MGRRLRLFTFLIGILTAASSFATAQGQPGRAPSNKSTIRFNLYRGYMVVAKGSVGPLKGLHFLVDTGTSTTLLAPRIARKLHLEGETEEINVIFFKGRVRSVHTRAPSIEFGPIRQSDAPVMVQDLSVLDADLPVQIDAVIGLAVLGQIPFQVDYRDCRIHFGPQPHLPVSIPLSKEDGLPMVNIEVNHATAHLIFDTGTPSLMIFKARLPRMIEGLRVRRIHDATNLLSSLEPQKVYVPSVHLGEAEFLRQKVILLENCDEGGRDFDGSLGPVALGIDAFAVDLERGALELLPGM